MSVIAKVTLWERPWPQRFIAPGGLDLAFPASADTLRSNRGHGRSQTEGAVQ